MATNYIDTDLLWMISTQMDAIAHEFGVSDVLTESAAEALGNKATAKSLCEFSYSWTTHRHRLVEAISNLAAMSEQVAHEFEEFDTSTAACLGP